MLRRLIEAGTQIVQMGYAGDGDVDDIVDAAQAEIYNVTERRTSEDYLPLSAIMEGALDEIEAIGSRGGEMVGVPTGLRRPRRADQRPAPRPDDRHRRPARGGQGAGPGHAPCRRPTAGRRWARSRPATTCSARTAGPTTVVAATEVMTGAALLRGEFDDGTVVVADADHQWLTDASTAGRRPPASAARRPRAGIAASTPSERMPARRRGAERRLAEVRPRREPLDAAAAELAGCRHVRPGRRRHRRSARLSAAPSAPSRGDEVAGRSSDRRSRAAVDAASRGASCAAGRRARPHPGGVPAAAASQRRELLAGLLDAAGQVDRDGSRAVHVRRVDWPTTCRTGRQPGLTGPRDRAGAVTAPRPTTAHPLTFGSGDDVFRVERKRACTRHSAAPLGPATRRPSPLHRRRARGRQRPGALRRGGQRRAPVPRQPVDDPDAQQHPRAGLRPQLPRSSTSMASCIFSLEMGRNEIAMRLLSAEARVPLHHMRVGHDDRRRLDAARPADGRGHRGAALHRRLARTCR